VAYGSRVVLEERCEDVVKRVRDALAGQDLVVIDELDLREAMQTKLGVTVPDQVVLGVCRAPLAVAALSVEASLGLLLPMRVVVRAAAAEVTVVEAADPVMMVAITGNPTLEPLVSDCAARLAAALHSLQG
jgi:uncharacterized protein (DUF302 family)